MATVTPMLLSPNTLQQPKPERLAAVGEHIPPILLNQLGKSDNKRKPAQQKGLSGCEAMLPSALLA